MCVHSPPAMNICVVSRSVAAAAVTVTSCAVTTLYTLGAHEETFRWVYI